MSACQPFFDEFCESVKAIYDAAYPYLIDVYDVELELDHKEISFRFYLRNARLQDDLYIRLRDDGEITCDLSLGYTDLPVCAIDNYGMRWITQGNHTISKKPVEAMVREIYLLSHEYKPYLRFLLTMSNTKEKASG